jgi:hypothetical protein
MKSRMLAVAMLTALTAAALVGVPTAAGDPEPETVSWSVRPADSTGEDGRAWVELELDPGATVTEHAAIRNLGHTDTTFALTAADGYFTDTGRFNMLPAGVPSVGAGTWIAVPATVGVPAGEAVIVPFTITVPDNAAPGDHAAGVAASITGIGAGSDGAQVGVESRVGFRVITRVTGELRPGLEISRTSSGAEASWNPFMPTRVAVTYTATNTGNAQLAYADQIADGAVTDRGEILPGESRTTSVQTWAWPLFLVPVDLELTLDVKDLPSGADPVRETVWVWAVPWSQMLVISGVALLIAALMIGRRRGQARTRRLIEEARDQGREAALDNRAT